GAGRLRSAPVDHSGRHALLIDRSGLTEAVRAQLLATEHWSLLAPRSMTWNEIFSRGRGARPGRSDVGPWAGVSPVCLTRVGDQAPGRHRDDTSAQRNFASKVRRT